ncbi:K02A2.6-like, partial [Cordylochernes scorpioides]
MGALGLAQAASSRSLGAASSQQQQQFPGRLSSGSGIPGHVTPTFTSCLPNNISQQPSPNNQTWPLYNHGSDLPNCVVQPEYSSHGKPGPAQPEAHAPGPEKDRQHEWCIVLRRKMAEYCKFGSTIDEAIRDRLIAGIEDDNIQRKLLGEGDSLTLHRAIEIALALEAAAQDAKDLQSQRNPEVVMKIKQGNWRLKPSTTGKFTRSEKLYMHRCGAKDHKQDKCPHLKAKCFNCGLISESTRRFFRLPNPCPADPLRVKLATYSGQPLPVLGTLDVPVQYQNSTQTLPLMVVGGEGPSLCGRNWMKALGILPTQPYKVDMIKLPCYHPASEPVEMVLLMDALDSSPVTSDDIRASLPGDPALRQALNYTLQGWSEETPKEIELMPYWSRRCELGACEGLLFWGNRVIIPTNLRAKMLDELHNSHQGIVGLKSVARTLFWWPGLDKDIEETVRRCNCCQSHASMPPRATPVNWPPTNQPWDRVHIDHLGPFEQNLYLIVVDACTKWIEAIPVPNTSTRETIEQLRCLFARFGIPRTLVSDNGTGFTSEEFRQFMTRNGIRHLRTAPFHPSSNGLAERAVQTIKTGLKKVQQGSISQRLAEILLGYRRTPIASIGKSPSEMMFGRNIRSRLDLILPNPALPVAGPLGADIPVVSSSASSLTNYSLSQHNSRNFGSQNLMNSGMSNSTFSSTPGLDLSEFPSLTNRGSQDSNSNPSLPPNPMAGRPAYEPHIGLFPVGMVKQPNNESNEFQIHNEDFPALPGSQTQDNNPDNKSEEEVEGAEDLEGSGDLITSHCDCSFCVIELLCDRAQEVCWRSARRAGTPMTSSPRRAKRGGSRRLKMSKWTDGPPPSSVLTPRCCRSLFPTFGGPWSDQPCRPQDI